MISLLAGIGGLPADAQEVSRKQFAVGATAGTLGIGAEASYLAYDYLAVRAAVTGLTFNAGEAVSYFGGEPSDADYNFDASGMTAGLLFDLHPFADGWRLTAGVRYMDVELNAVNNNGATLGTQTFTAAQIGSLSTSIRNSNPAAPYLGFGYDAAHYLRDGSRFTLGFEVGALYAGQPDVKLSTTINTALGLDAAVAAEEKTIRDSLKQFYWFYPVVMFSGKMSF